MRFVSVAVLGWGSLIWRPTDHGVTLDLQTPGLWACDGPNLPIEFARISQDDSLTLVVLPGSAETVVTLWSVSSLSESDAVLNLAAREDISKNFDAIHGVRMNGSKIGRVDAEVAAHVHGWMSERQALSAVIWTGLGTALSRWREKGYTDGFSVDNAISYFRSLKGDAADRAFEYLRNAPAQIDTRVRQNAQAAGLIG